MAGKYVIVGGVAGGASTAARLRRLDEEAVIIVFERDDHVSFSNCGLPYLLSGDIPHKDKLVLMNPTTFKNQYNIDTRVNSEVVEIDRENKKVKVKSRDRNEYEETYDYLILSPGADVVVPPIPGLDTIPHFIVKNVVTTAALHEYIQNPDNKVRNIAVLGAGFIGLEVMENLKKAGFNVSLIEVLDDILPLLDPDMVQILQKELLDKGIDIHLGTRLEKIASGILELSNGKRIPADALVLATGIKPAIEFAKKAGIEIGESGAIRVDSNGLTNDPCIYAVGDAVEVYSRILHKYIRLPLAGPAQKAARNVANHIYRQKVTNNGFIHSFCIQLFDYNVACTGLTENFLKKDLPNLQYSVVKIIPQDKVGIMPGSQPLHFKLIYERPSGKVLGAQAIGKCEVTKRIDIIATLIKMDGTIHDLQDLELTYAPPFSTAKDITNMAGYVGSNLLAGDFCQVDCSQVRELVTRDAIIVDVREKSEWDAGHIKKAVNIPLSEIRQRIGEFSRVKPVYVHCRSGQRSYNAVRLLRHYGIDAYNIGAGFLGLSFFEYFHDKVQNREPIVTEYNFD